MAVASPSSLDYNDEQKAIIEMVRQFADEQIIPNAEHYDAADEYPEPIVEQMKELGLFGITVPEEYGGLGLDLTTYCMVVEELSRGWISISGVINTHFIGTYLLMKFGNDEQKQKYLPRMARGELIGCFGLTEPHGGSDPGNMKTHAKRRGGDWVINGSKMWITNAPIADLVVLWARTEDGIRGFLIEKGTRGLAAPEIENKFSLRASATGALYFEDVVVPDSAMLPGSTCGLKAPLSCLTQARYGITWGVIGAAQACLSEVLEYSKTRILFDRPIAATQAVQIRLAEMARKITTAQLLCLQLGRLKDAGRMSPSQVSLAKWNNCRAAIDIARDARDLLGGAGISAEYVPIRHALNLESVITYEGTETIHQLTIGRELTGLNAF
jgi:glutaryl-CoA dehydrogenase